MDAREPAGTTTAEGEEGNFLSFAVGGETCAVDLGAVREIIRVPPIVGVPLSPPAVAGLLNLRGHVLPVVDARRALGFPGEAPGEQARVVVLHRGALYGLLVDRVSGVIAGEPEPLQGAREGGRDFLSGTLHAGERVVMILDPERLGAGQIQSPAGEDGSLAGTALESPAGEGGEDEGYRYLTFLVAGQEYGLPVESVREIGRLPAELGRVPKAASHLLGIAPLRGRLVPLVDLPALLGLPGEAPDGRRRVLVLGTGTGVPVGLVVDGVKEVLHADREPEALPALWERPEDAELQGMLSLDGGKRLVAVLAPGRLLQAALPELEEEGITMAEEQPGPAAGAEDSEILVVFYLGSQEFGVPVEAVREILRVPEQLSRVPGAEDFVEGMVNLRGRVLPVLDQRRRLGLEKAERSHRQRILVVERAGGTAGFAVDGVRDVLAVPRPALGPAPAMNDDRSRVVGRVANLADQGRLILVLDPEELLRGTEAPATGETAP